MIGLCYQLSQNFMELNAIALSPHKIQTIKAVKKTLCKIHCKVKAVSALQIDILPRWTALRSQIGVAIVVAKI